MVTRTINISQLPAFTKRLQKELSKVGVDILQATSKSLTRRLRKNAPAGPTRSLKTDIKAKIKSANKIQIVGPGHWSFVNRGLAPNFPIPIELLEGHLGSPGSTAGKSANITNPKGFFQPVPSKKKGFVEKSARSLERDMGKIIEKEIAQAYARI